MVTATPHMPRLETDHRVVLSGISWPMYEQLVDQLERAGRRLMLTYDNGELEIELPNDVHEFLKTFIADLLAIYFVTMSVPYLPACQTTFKRRLSGQGGRAGCIVLSEQPVAGRSGGA